MVVSQDMPAREAGESTQCHKFVFDDIIPGPD